jgi:protein-S-isoprenylcysteine O-methyltransferase Ste14
VDTVRYWLAVLLVCTLPPFLVYWPIVHGFIGFWRRIGPTLTFVIVLSGTLVGVATLYRARTHLLLVDYGTNWALVALGVGLLGVGVFLRMRVNRVFRNKTLLGLPELAPDNHPQKLVRSGIYARIRHPRYAQFFVALGGYALIANYLGAYLVWLAWLPGVYVLVWFEERELRDRFGQEYDDYCRQVPRFVPKLPAFESAR